MTTAGGWGVDAQVVPRTSHSRPPASRRLPSFAGRGLPERMRSTVFAFLGLTAAGGLALVAIFAQPNFPLLSPAPLPSDPSRANAIAEAAVVSAHPRLHASVPAPLFAAAPDASRQSGGGRDGGATTEPGRDVAVGDGEPNAAGAGGVSSPGGAADVPAPTSDPPAATPAPAPEPVPTPAPAPAPTPTPEPAPAPVATSQEPTPSPPSTSPGRSTAASPGRGNSKANGGSKGPPAHAASVRKSSGGAPAPPAPPPPPPPPAPSPAPAAAPAASGAASPSAGELGNGNGKGKALGHSK